MSDLIVPQTSETKLCPRSTPFVAAMPDPLRGNINITVQAGFGPCVEKKCQLWRVVAVEQIGGEDGVRETYDCVWARALERAAFAESADL